MPDLSSTRLISLDIETCDPDLKTKGPGVRTNGYMVGIGVGTEDGYRNYFPFGHAEGAQLDKEVVLHWARTELCRPNQIKIGANLIYDLDYLAEEGVNVTGPFYDIQNAEPLIDENQRLYNLDILSHKYLEEGKDEDLLIKACRERGLADSPHGNIWALPPSMVGEYAMGDVDRPIRIFEQQKILLEQQNLWDLFILETKLVPLLLRMKRRGVLINQDKVAIAHEASKKKLKKLRQELNSQAGMEIDIWAATSIAKAYDRLGLRYPRTPKSDAPSFTKDWLERHAHPISPLLAECRKLDKFVGTFLEGSIIEQLVNGRIHCQFNQQKGDKYGTVTGRFSSSNPNLQFIPIRDEVLGPLMRSFFIPEPGEEWYKADYNQIEMRLLAHYAMGRGADEIRRKYNEEKRTDYHDATSSMANVNRFKAKTTNFLIIYGGGAALLAQHLKTTVEEAQKFLKIYFSKLPFIKNTINLASKTAANRGYVKTILNRRRRFHKWEPSDWELSKIFTASADKDKVIAYIAEQIKLAITDPRINRIPSKGIRKAYTYKALNAVIQGSAADVMKKAMVDIEESGVLNELGDPSLTVHDELDGSKPKTKVADEALKEMVLIMENTIQFKVPILVDYSVGKHWGDVK